MAAWLSSSLDLHGRLCCGLAFLVWKKRAEEAVLSLSGMTDTFLESDATHLQVRGCSKVPVQNGPGGAAPSQPSSYSEQSCETW